MQEKVLEARDRNSSYHHQSAEDVELCQADALDVVACLGPVKQDVLVGVAEALKAACYHVGKGGYLTLQVWTSCG